MRGLYGRLMPGSSSSHHVSRRAALALGLGAAASVTLPGPRAAAAVSAVGGERLGRSGVQVASGAPRLPKLAAKAWLVADHDSGDVLASYAAHRALPPASTLKMLFADTVLPKFGRTSVHKVTAADLAGIPYGSSLVGVQAGTSYTVEQLWQGVFLRSGNDAVHVLASMNGGVGETVRQMQARAKDLQANDTHVVSPDGFDHKGQVSSAYDLTLFARAGLKNDDFRGYCATKTADFPAGGKKTFQIQNTDRLLTGQGVAAYQGLIGVKNGYTSHMRQHVHRRGDPRRAHPARHRHASQVRVRGGVRGDGGAARLGVRGGGQGRSGGHAGHAAERAAQGGGGEAACGGRRRGGRSRRGDGHVPHGRLGVRRLGGGRGPCGRRTAGAAAARARATERTSATRGLTPGRWAPDQ